MTLLILLFPIKLLAQFNIFKKHNVLIEEVNKIALIVIDDKRIQSIDSIETYAYRLSKDLVCKKEETKYHNIIKPHKND